jgi:hypothetical protein
MKRFGGSFSMVTLMTQPTIMEMIVDLLIWSDHSELHIISYQRKQHRELMTPIFD